MRLAAVCAAACAALAARGVRPAAADPAACAPAARVAGDPELGASIELELAVLGVVSRDVPAACPAVDVDVSRAGDAVVVVVRDAAGRRAQETVTDTHVAAVWIDSWARPELGAPLLVPRAEVAPPVVAPPTATAPAPTRAPVGLDAAATHGGLVLDAGGGLLYGDDGSTWRALDLGLCARLGRLCIGAAATLADDRNFSHNGGMSQTDRLAGALLATVSAALPLGQMHLVPSAGLGAVWTRATRGAGCSLQMDPANQLDCETPVVVEDGFEIDTLAVRARLGLAGAFPVSDRVSFLLGGAIEWTFLGRDEATLPSYIDPDASGGMDPDGALWPIEAYEMPADPTRHTRIGAALRVGWP